MAASSCVKCGGFVFELKVAEPIHSAFKVCYIQCATCGGVAGALESINAGDELDKLEQRIKKIEALTEAIARKLLVSSL